MKLSFNLLISVYASFMIFTWFSFFFGPDGYVETQKLKQYLVKIQTNTLKMDQIREKLEAEVQGLRDDTGTIALEARSLGYYSKNEGVLFVDGYRPQKRILMLGSLYKKFRGRHMSISFIRYVSLFVGLLVFLLLLIRGRRKSVYTYRQRYSEV